MLSAVINKGLRRTLDCAFDCRCRCRCDWIVISFSSILFFVSSSSYSLTVVRLSSSTPRSTVLAGSTISLRAPYSYAGGLSGGLGETPQRGLGQSPREGPWPDPLLSLKFLWYAIAQNRKIWTGHSGYILYRAEHYGTHAGTHKVFFITAPQHASTGINSSFSKNKKCSIVVW